ncbi:MAG: hypothetical protein EOM69_10510, partial [Clostridia bacterium]|nr:hypothetical protein [Clostridia bacterium]
MFGYIRPLECELKVREQAEYRGVCCGLCKSIGRRYGQIERLTLSYDCAFLALTLLAINGDAKFTPGNCGPRVYRGKRPIADASPTLDYAADVNVLLAWYKALDDQADERSAGSFAARIALKRAYRKAARANPVLDYEIRESMSQLHELELEECAVLDEPSNAFGRLLSSVILNAPTLPVSEKKAAQWMFYNLGKWVYLIDAWDDREQDEKRGGYNPFVLGRKSAEDAEFLLNITQSEAEKGYNLISFHTQSGLMDNIMRLGLD